MSLQAVAEAQRVEGLTYTRGLWFGGQHVGVRQEEVSPGPTTQLAVPGEGSGQGGCPLFTTGLCKWRHILGEGGWPGSRLSVGKR